MKEAGAKNLRPFRLGASSITSTVIIAASALAALILAFIILGGVRFDKYEYEELRVRVCTITPRSCSLSLFSTPESMALLKIEIYGGGLLVDSIDLTSPLAEPTGGIELPGGQTVSLRVSPSDKWNLVQGDMARIVLFTEGGEWPLIEVVMPPSPMEVGPKQEVNRTLLVEVEPPGYPQPLDEWEAVAYIVSRSLKCTISFERPGGVGQKVEVYEEGKVRDEDAIIYVNLTFEGERLSELVPSGGLYAYRTGFSDVSFSAIDEGLGLESEPLRVEDRQYASWRAALSTLTGLYLLGTLAFAFFLNTRYRMVNLMNWQRPKLAEGLKRYQVYSFLSFLASCLLLLRWALGADSGYGPPRDLSVLGLMAMDYGNLVDLAMGMATFLFTTFLLELELQKESQRKVSEGEKGSCHH